MAVPPNRAVQLTPLARFGGWARFTRQSAPACWQLDHPKPSGAHAAPTRIALQGSAARTLPGSCLLPASSTLHTPASGAADRCPLGVTHTMPSPPRPFDLNAFSGPFRSESDRACAVLGAALIDERLKQLFDRRLHYSNEALLLHSGVLGSFSSRISVARALTWIADDVRFDLDQVRDIRNKFAHNADHELSFADQSIADKCRTLKVARTLLDAHEALAALPPARFSPEVIRAMAAVFQSPRQRFEITIEILAQHLDELGSTRPEYSGPNLREELWALGMQEPTVRIQATVLPQTTGESGSANDRPPAGQSSE